MPIHLWASINDDVKVLFTIGVYYIIKRVKKQLFPTEKMLENEWGKTEGKNGNSSGLQC